MKDLVRAELTIKHRAGDAVALLSAALGPHDPAALAASAFARDSPVSAASITYARFIPDHIVMVWPTPGQVVLYVESSRGFLREGAERAWALVRASAPDLRPKLVTLVLVDETAHDALASAEVGFGANYSRPELRYTLFLGAATAVWLIVALSVFSATGDLVLGSIPAILASVFAGLTLVRDSLHQELVWQ